MTCPATNLSEIQKEIGELASHQGFAVPEIMAVTKGQSIETIERLLKGGHRFFGESRVQEALEKWIPLKQKYSDVNLHLIGPLQTNKVKEAIKIFDRIETLDRISLAQELCKAFDKFGFQRELLIQVNTSLEAQKSGVLPEELENFYSSCKKLNLSVRGLMCIPAIDQDPSNDFKSLQDAARTYSLPLLSMGMSKDYHVAIRYGTSWVRIGTRLFGFQ